jgi:nucleotide-binding universal stress UspA family protein
MYQRIVVALDGSALAEHVLPHAEAFAQRFGATLVLVRVNPRLSTSSAAASPPQDPTLVHRLEGQAADEYLARIAEQLRANGSTVEMQLPTGHPAEEIVAYARSAGADLIAMTTHGRSGLARLVFGSVATEVLQQAPCPVLLIRARG